MNQTCEIKISFEHFYPSPRMLFEKLRLVNNDLDIKKYANFVETTSKIINDTIDENEFSIL